LWRSSIDLPLPLPTLPAQADRSAPGCHQRGGLPPQELPPVGYVAARGEIDAGSLENRPHGTCRNLVAKPGQFALDPSVTPGTVLDGQSQD